MRFMAGFFGLVDWLFLGFLGTFAGPNSARLREHASLALPSVN